MPLAMSALLLSALLQEPWSRHTIDDSSKGADGVRLADVNGDGLPDFVTGWEEGGVVRVYVNPGPAKARGKWPAVTVGRAPSVEDAVLVDLDGDGALDVVSSCEGKTRRLNFHWAPKDRLLDPDAWTTAPLAPSLDVMMWMFVLPAQIDGKHGIDLFAGGKGKGAAIGWFEAPADPRKVEEWKWHPIRDCGWLMSLVASDMDGDGDADLLFTDRKGKASGCSWLENGGAWKEHPVGAAGREVMFAALADLDGDGLEDVLAAVKPREIHWMRRMSRDGRSWEAKAIPLPDFSGTAKAVIAGDVDLDGSPDLVVTCEESKEKQGVLWMKRTGDAWRPQVLGGVDGVKHDLVLLLDLDGDGDPDALTCEETKNLGVFWYENPARRRQ